jgi:hypothetical protein
VELSTGTYYGIYPSIPLGLTAAITVTRLKQQLFCVWFSANGACVTNNAITVTVLKDPNLNNFENKTKTF